MVGEGGGCCLGSSARASRACCLVPCRIFRFRASPPGQPGSGVVPPPWSPKRKRAPCSALHLSFCRWACSRAHRRWPPSSSWWPPLREVRSLAWLIQRVPATVLVSLRLSHAPPTLATPFARPPPLPPRSHGRHVAGRHRGQQHRGPGQPGHERRAPAVRGGVGCAFVVRGEGGHSLVEGCSLGGCTWGGRRGRLYGCAAASPLPPPHLSPDCPSPHPQACSSTPTRCPTGLPGRTTCPSSSTHVRGIGEHDSTAARHNGRQHVLVCTAPAALYACAVLNPRSASTPCADSALMTNEMSGIRIDFAVRLSPHDACLRCCTCDMCIHPC